MAAHNKLLTIKIGSNVITDHRGFPDKSFISTISSQISELRSKGYQVLLISSGAVAAGRSIYQFDKKADTIAQRQVLSSIGQVRLISLYKETFEEHNMLCSQVLVTREDFRSRNHYRNMQNCLSALLSNNIVPIINENDVVSITELMFTDNDELAGLVSTMMNADKLIILTNVDGVYDGDPESSGTKLIDVFDRKLVNVDQIVSNGKKSGFGRGGILTKCHTAEKISKMGIPVVIANGRADSVLVRIIDNEKLGTLFPAKKVASGIKKYLGHGLEEIKGMLVINEGAKKVLQSEKANSLLPIGVIKVVGEFKQGDIIKIVDDQNQELGLGLSRINSSKAEEIIGQKNQKPIIHYDHLYLH